MENPCRQMIVHPKFPLLKPRAPKRVDWNELPLELLLHAAQFLDAQDLCRLAAVNHACRCQLKGKLTAGQTALRHHGAD